MQSINAGYLPDNARVVDGRAQTTSIEVPIFVRTQRHALKLSLALVLPEHIAVAFECGGGNNGLRDTNRLGIAFEAWRTATLSVQSTHRKRVKLRGAKLKV